MTATATRAWLAALAYHRVYRVWAAKHAPDSYMREVYANHAREAIRLARIFRGD